MREEDIRPQALLDENLRLQVEDTKELLRHHAQFDRVLCPACQSELHELSFVRNGFDFVRCIECLTLYVSPRPSRTLLFDFFRTAKSVEHWNKKLFPASEQQRREQIYSGFAERVIELCEKHSVPTGVLVDAGAGFGTFCDELKLRKRFDRVVAIELCHSMAETCRGRGIETIEKPIEEASIDGVDVVTCFQVLESFYSPREFISNCYNALRPNGLLILTVPDITGFDLATLGELSNHLVAPNHMNCFTKNSLTQLLQDCGFTVVHTETPGRLDAELVRKAIVAGHLDVSDQPFLRRVLIDEWERLGGAFQAFLSENKLSSFLWITASRD